jgi:fatty-acyl-CoA synthase
MIISGGFNIYPTDIEAAICAHPDVLMAAVVGVPHADWGEAVHAEVLMRQGAAFDEDGLRQFLAEKLPAYKKPKTITAVSELPLSPVGKVLRKDVRAKYWGNRKRAVN